MYWKTIVSICLLVVLASSAGAVMLGTPPAPGQLIEEVGVMTANSLETIHISETGFAEMPAYLPLPIYPSGAPADYSECLWSIGILGLDPYTESFPLDISYELDGVRVIIRFEIPQDRSVFFDIILEITATAIRTTEPVGTERTTLSRVKEIYR